MSDMTELKGLIETQGRAFEEFKATNDALIKAKAEGKSVTDLEAKLAKIDDELNKTGELKERIERIELANNRKSVVGGDEDIGTEVKQFNLARKAASQGAADVSTDEYRAYKGAFIEFMRKGTAPMQAEQVKALQAGVDSDGGYLLPPSTVGRIVTKVNETSAVRRLASVQVISTDSLEGLYDRDEASCGWVGEVGTRSDTNTPTLGKYKVEAFEMYAQPKATQKLLDDAAVDIEQWLAMKVADKFARTEATAFVTGTGVGQPRGFATYTTAATADSSRTWGQLEHVKSGLNGAFAASSPADCLFSLIGAFKAPYLSNAVWATTREVITAIRKLKEATTNAYMWQPSLQQGQPDRLLGYPIEIMADIAALATDSLSLFLGDFRSGYQIVDRMGIRVLRDPFTDKPYVKFYSTRRTGGAVLDFDAIKAIKFST